MLSSCQTSKKTREVFIVSWSESRRRWLDLCCLQLRGLVNDTRIEVMIAACSKASRNTSDKACLTSIHWIFFAHLRAYVVRASTLTFFWEFQQRSFRSLKLCFYQKNARVNDCESTEAIAMEQTVIATIELCNCDAKYSNWVWLDAHHFTFIARFVFLKPKTSAMNEIKFEFNCLCHGSLIHSTLKFFSPLH